MPPSNTTPCRFFAKGFCRFGDDCRFLHSQEKKKNSKLLMKVAVSPPKIKVPSQPSNSRVEYCGYAVVDPNPIVEKNPGKATKTDSPAKQPKSTVTWNLLDFLRLTESVNDIRLKKKDPQPIPEQTMKTLFYLIQLPTVELKEKIDALGIEEIPDGELQWEVGSDDYDEEDEEDYDDDDDDDDEYYDSEMDEEYDSEMEDCDPLYEERYYPDKESCYWNNAPLDWSKINFQTRNLVFTANFYIGDSHIKELTEHPNLCSRLERFCAGDADNGSGSSVRNEDQLVSFVKLCPNLRVLYLESFIHMTDKTLIAAFRSCPLLERVHLSGHDKQSGNVAGDVLEELLTNPKLVPRLQLIELFNQSNTRKPFRNLCERLTKERGSLEIVNGNTVGPSMAANHIASLTGGEPIFIWRQGKVRVRMDEGISHYIF